MIETPAPEEVSPAASLRKMRVGVICDFVEENWPSMDLVAGMLTDHLVRDHSCTVQAVPICPPLRRRFGKLPSPALWNADRLVNRFFDYPRFLKPRLKDFDLFHVIDHSYSQLVHELPPGTAVVTCHDLDTFRCVLEPERQPRPRWFRAMAGRILEGFRKAAHVIAVSLATRDEILHFGLHPANRVTVVSNGVHPSCTPAPVPPEDSQLARLLSERIGAEESKDGIWLMNVGSVMPRKRLDLLLQVFAELRRHLPNVRLIRVGELLTAEHWALARRLGVQARIVELGFLTRDLLAAAYRRADLLVHTADAEGFGLPLIEAMACGCQVIASDIPVLREVGGEAATYCAVGEIDGWAKTIVATLARRANPGQRKLEQASAIAHAARFSWAENATRTVRIYQQVLRKEL